MATSVGNLRFILKETTINVFKQHGINFRNIEVTKKSNNFKNGDFVIPIGCHEHVRAEVLCTVRQDLLAELKMLMIPVSKISGDKYNSIVIHLDRTQCFVKVIKFVLNESEKYGLCLSELSGHVLLNNINLLCLRQHRSSLQHGSEGRTPLNLDFVRSVILQQHIAHLLQAHGLKVSSLATDANIDLCRNFLSDIGSDSDKFTRIEMHEAENCCMMDTFLNHPCVTQSQEDKDEANKEGLAKGTTHHSDDNIKHTEMLLHNETVETCQEFSLRQYIQDSGLPIGRSHFDKNLNICNVMKNGEASDVLRQACLLRKGIQECKASTCVHITDQSSAFSQQKVHLLLQAMSELGSEDTIPQMHFVYGSVTPRKDCAEAELMTADQYFTLRYSQMRQAAVLKYGETVHGEGWTATLQVLTAACIKFEMLSSVPRNTLKLNLSDSDMDNAGEATLSGSFVMYNCARLATLFSHFEESVEAGMYPPLPKHENIDFTTLREEQEWSLLFNFVYMFPDIIKQTVETFPSTDTLHAKIHTHKICQMLCTLSRSISSYYSRYHVLGEPRAHVLPTMYARLYLLKAVYQVLVNGLALLDIQPLSQL